jgi:hypothetical protein
VVSASKGNVPTVIQALVQRAHQWRKSDAHIWRPLVLVFLRRGYAGKTSEHCYYRYCSHQVRSHLLEKKLVVYENTSISRIVDTWAERISLFPQYTQVTKMNNTEVLGNLSGKPSAYPEVSPTPIVVDKILQVASNRRRFPMTSLFH